MASLRAVVESRDVAGASDTALSGASRHVKIFVNAWTRHCDFYNSPSTESRHGASIWRTRRGELVSARLGRKTEGFRDPLEE